MDVRTPQTSSSRLASSRLGEVTRYFLRLGATGFGGPVALVGQTERDLVVEKSG